MKRFGILMAVAGAIAVTVLPVARNDDSGGRAYGEVRPVVDYAYGYPPPVAYGGVTPAAIVDRVGEILAAIDSPQDRSKLAAQWLEFSKRIIAKDLEFREQWLEFQKRQLSRGEEIERLRLQVAQLQIRVEELRAENLRLEQQNQQRQPPPGPESGGRADGGASSPSPQETGKNSTPSGV
jgi:hypothetical protein